PAHAQDPTFRERFLREVRVMMEFVHPNAITVRDFGLSQSGLLYMTMDFSVGKSLKDVIESSSLLSAERVLGITRQALMALAEGHKKGIVHRDIKPDNILIEQDTVDGQAVDKIKVLDFGIAKILEQAEPEGEGLTGRHVIGTPAY